MSRQDVENAAQVHIDALGKLAESFGFTQAILFAHSQETGTVVNTWGIDAIRSAQAAAGANTIKVGWGWPEDTIVESQKVLALQRRIEELETLLASRVEEAFFDGFSSVQTYNDTLLNTADDAWEKAKTSLLRKEGVK